MTVEELRCALNKMRKVYKFTDSKTMVSCGEPFSGNRNYVSVITTDEIDGVRIEMGINAEQLKEKNNE